MKDRLKEVRKNHGKGKTQDAFAKFLGVPKENISSYETGRRSPSDAFMHLVCEKCYVNYEWLKNGTGEMYKIKDDSFSRMLSNLEDSDDDFIKSLIKAYMELDEDSKEALRKIAKKMSEKYEKPV